MLKINISQMKVKRPAQLLVFSIFLICSTDLFANGVTPIPNDTINKLNEIEIKADKIVRRKDGIIIFPQKAQLNFASNGYDLLDNMMIPGVYLDKDGYQMSYMGQTVGIYINGHKASSAEVKNLKASSVKKVEFYDTTSGEFISDKTAINIVLINEDNSYYLAADDKQTAGYNSNELNSTFQYFGRRKHLSVFMGNSYHSYNNKGANQEENYIFPSWSIVRNSSVLLDEQKGNSQYFQCNGHVENKKSAFSARFSVVRDYIPTIETEERIMQDDMEMKRQSERNERALLQSLELTGRFLAQFKSSV